MKATLIFPGITRQGWDCFGKENDSESAFIPYLLAGSVNTLKIKHEIECGIAMQA